MKIQKTFSICMLFGLLFLTTVAAGQRSFYFPLINSDNTWSIVANSTAGGGDISSFYLKIDDTIVEKNRRLYHKVFLTYDTLGIEDYWNHVGYMSEDTETGECYFMNLNLQEGMIYNFSACVGDTLQIWNSYQGNLPGEAIILDKDSVLIGDTYRVRLSVMNILRGLEEYWIEGIGSIEGLLFSNYWLIGIDYALLCFFENGELVYHNDEYSTCYYGLPTGIGDLSSSGDLIVYPNPVKNHHQVFIRIPDNENIGINKLSIYSLSGSCIGSWQFYGNQYTLILSTLQSGYYIVELINSNTKYHKKIQIN
nr:T9SS type A sorting domain-containing protein [Bacteroidota bacterium]